MASLEIANHPILVVSCSLIRHPGTTSLP
jgi:hypothetical protein